MYRHLVKPLLFGLDAERAHDLTLRASAFAGRSRLVRQAAHRAYAFEHPRLRTEVAGMTLANPLGLAAGFDKNGRTVPMLDALGFGLVEIGSVSAHPSDGNPRPRLFRIPQDRAVVVSYGVPNEGAEAVARNVARPRHGRLGINLVKTNDPRRPAVEPNVYEDYARSFALLAPRSDYVALNLSCPNAADDRDFFDDPVRVDTLLERLAACAPHVPVVLKLKPTADVGLLRELVAIGDRHPFVRGFAINLPAGKPPTLQLATPPQELARKPGAVGGPPVEPLVNSVLQTLRELTGPDSRHALFAAGGVTTAEDAYRKLRLGASVVQVYTGLIYRGPRIVREILEGLVRLLEQDGHATVAEAVGADVDGR